MTDFEMYLNAMRAIHYDDVLAQKIPVICFNAINFLAEDSFPTKNLTERLVAPVFYTDVGKHVDVPAKELVQLKLGAIVYFYRPAEKTPCHVMMYLGNGILASANNDGQFNMADAIEVACRKSSFLMFETAPYVASGQFVSRHKENFTLKYSYINDRRGLTPSDLALTDKAMIYTESLYSFLATLIKSRADNDAKKHAMNVAFAALDVMQMKNLNGNDFAIEILLHIFKSIVTIAFNSSYFFSINDLSKISVTTMSRSIMATTPTRYAFEEIPGMSLQPIRDNIQNQNETTVCQRFLSSVLGANVPINEICGKLELTRSYRDILMLSAVVGKYF